uniref:F-box protein 4 n=1 Tax=Neolamprologus brichardi TaxID=32507 RepID=A0A3Q4HM54_NEOBR
DMAEKIQQLESLVIRSLRRFRDRYFPDKVVEADLAVGDSGKEEQQYGFLDTLPVDVQFLIMTFLSPADLCHLGATSRYWRAMVRDPLLWRYFLLRDMPHWPSIDHSLDDREEGNEGIKLKFDYMSEYLKGCPFSRQQWLPTRPAYEVVTSFFQSLVPSSEPRYAMFGPGMEQLDVSLVTRLMHAPDILPVSGTPHRQINGIGSGISYMFNNQHKFNILTLYSTNRAERERARVQQESISNKLFTFEGNDDSGDPVCVPAPQVQQVCQVVDGFIYVANADTMTHHTQWFLTDQCRTSAVGSCTRSMCRTPCVDMAKRLGLPHLPNPWMVQDTVAESLSGLLDGISWLLRCSGVKLY